MKVEVWAEPGVECDFTKECAGCGSMEYLMASLTVVRFLGDVTSMTVLYACANCQYRYYENTDQKGHSMCTEDGGVPCNQYYAMGECPHVNNNDSEEE